ncbi:bifunctional serine/threonine-protein kinase/formylglycine-generating enzyme family protein [Wenzhouxiangella sp. EGI_FJ10305]|uniref:bifunctional serine/threonine-protein kinase/formylglycine-generating enzyme family protein n=1 Tax=Wenzhouxiangella sp. EGI_FJ10305 TaxID=3243768 RepID=UPI0035DC53D9
MKLQRFTGLSRLGSGGFGEVFLGEDPAIGRQVAIKVFKPKDDNLVAFATSSDEEGLEILRARFLSEAKILASLHNVRNIVEVLEYGELDDGSPFYVMPYLPRSLADELGRDVFDVKALEELPEGQRPRALPMERALEILEQVLRGLAAAHSRGLIHRDIKPSNIMLTEDDDVRIVDFGIAKAPDGQHSTVSHLGLGSRNYMAPEQRESAKHVDARADVYSVGRLAYRMLTGRLPVGRFADPNVAVPEIGKAMNDVILAALEEDRDKRPEDAGELLEQFEAAKSGVGEQTGESDTGTWVGEGEAGIRDELKPLRAKIAEVIGHKGCVSDEDRPGLAALASIADLDGADLDQLISDVSESDKELKAKFRLFQSLKREVQVRGRELTTTQLASYDTAAEAVGWNRNKIKALMDEAVAELNQQDKPGSSTSSSGDTFANLKSRFRLPLKPIAAALLALVVLGGIGYGVYDWRQGQLAEAEAERKRQLAEQQEDAAWGEARGADTIDAYESFLDQWPNGLHQQAASERIVQLKEQGQNTIARVQDYLNRLGYRVPEHGEVDTRTTESIRDFEEAQGLVVTATPDEVVLESLIEEFNRRDDEAWAQASDADTEEAYNEYRKDFPQGRYMDQLDTRIAAVRDRKAWEAARDEDSEAAYRQYAEAFPEGAHVDDVAARITAVRQAEAEAQRQRELAAHREAANEAWAEAKEQDTEAAYKSYLDLYPDGQHRESAQSAIERLIAEAREVEDRRWAHAQNVDSSREYQTYLDEYPDGRFVSEAREAQAAAQAREEFISQIQTETRRLGPEIEVDGQLNEDTQRAIRHFERWTDQQKTGEPTEGLLAQLEASSEWPGPKPGESFRDCAECPEMVVIPAGSFRMGSPSGEADRQNNEGPQHRVTVPMFALGKTEVTFAQWDACVRAGGCNHRPGDQGWGRGDRPVINVSWDDAQEYVRWLSGQTGEDYRLPSEAEWEYAARAGTATRFHTGHCITTDQANFHGNYPPQGCGKGRYRGRTVAVGSFPPNDFGLQDMHGNVWEWVQDCWNDSYRGAPSDGSAWMSGDCRFAGVRGGSWSYFGHNLRSAYRNWFVRVPGGNGTGFRPARSVMQ